MEEAEIPAKWTELEGASLVPMPSQIWSVGPR